MKSILHLLATLLLLASWPAYPAASEDPKAVAEQLKALEAEIAKFREVLETTKGERDTLQDSLRVNEKQISDLLKKIEQIQKDLQKGEDKVSSLRKQQTALELAKSEQQQLIGRQIRAAYEIGNQEYLKVVLNQEDPNLVARMLTYYDYFNRARAEQVETFKGTIIRLESVKQEIVVQNESLANDRARIREQKSTLDVAQAARRQTLAALTKQIAIAGNELVIRAKDRERLEALLERITAGITNLPTPEDTVAFSDRRGKLLLPVAGRITNHFGTARNGGKLKWDGIFIAARTGEPVAAVHYGRIVFSDWLRGFGLLLIINHGNGYMSLYGHNQVLYRETGDWVTAGETIATVGDSGGQNTSGLYFEIRHAGTPTDPQIWCQARRDRTA